MRVSQRIRIRFLFLFFFIAPSLLHAEVVHLKLKDSRKNLVRGWKSDDPAADVISELEAEPKGEMDLGLTSRKKEKGETLELDLQKPGSWKDKQNKQLRYPVTMIVPPEHKGPEPSYREAAEKKLAVISIPKFWKSDTPTPDRRMILEIRYRDTASRLAEVCVYNGRKFRNKNGFRRIGFIGGIDDKKWKTAFFVTSPYDFRKKEKTGDTAVALKSHANALAVAYVKIHEFDRKKEIEARKHWRRMLYIRSDVRRRHLGIFRWEDKGGSDKSPTNYEKALE